MTPGQIEKLLPDVLRRASGPRTPLRGLLEVMSDFLAPTEDLLGDLDRWFDPWRCPSGFLAHLAGWVDLDWLLLPDPRGTLSLAERYPPGEAALRALVAAAAPLARTRGTAAELEAFLLTATGVEGFVLDDTVLDTEGRALAFFLEVRVPSEAAPFLGLIERIVAREKPAYVAHRIVVFPRPETS